MKMTVHQDPVEIIREKLHEISKFFKNQVIKKLPWKTLVREKALKEKLKIAELLVEASFAEEKYATIWNAEKLRQTEEFQTKGKIYIKIFLLVCSVFIIQ